MDKKQSKDTEKSNKLGRGKSSVKISIIIPCYNQEKYISQCLDGIINQAFNDIEIICVDDGSTDETLKILQAYKQKDKRLKIVKFEKNRGTSDARKAGVLASCGDYVMFADPDDSLAPKTFQTAYAAITKQKVDILQFGTNVVNQGVNEKAFDIFQKNCEPYPCKLFGTEVFFSCFESQLFNFNLWNKIYSGDLVRLAFSKIDDGYYPKAQDMYAFFLIAYFAKSYGSIDNKLYNYYFGRGITGKRSITLDRFSKISTQMRIIEQLFLFFDNENPSDLCHYLSVLNKRGRIFYNEVMANFSYVENLSENSKPALEFLLSNLKPVSSKNIFKNPEIWNNYINFLFERFSNLIFEKKLNHELVIYEYLEKLFVEKKLSDEAEDSALFEEIKRLVKFKSARLGQIFPVVFATNDNYAPYLSVTIQSIKQHATNENFYDLYIFHTSLSSQNQFILKSMASSNVSIKLVNVLPYVENLRNYSHSHYSIEMYYRILIPEILNNYEKVLYLDCDLVALDDISKFFEVDISNYILAGVKNEVNTEYMKKYVTNTLGLSLDEYFNSGVLLFNTKKFIDESIKEQCFETLNKFEKLSCPDQDILNLSAKGKCLLLPKIWNYQAAPNNFSLFDKYYFNQKIIHYTSGVKPWNTENLPLAEKFWEFARNSPFYENIVKTYLSATLKINSEQKENAKPARNIINENQSLQTKHLFSWPFRMTKNFFVSVKKSGLRRTMPKVKIKLKYAFNRMAGRVDKFNNPITKPVAEKTIKIKQKELKPSDYPKAVENWFFDKTKIRFDIENPKSLSEKIQWIKIYDAQIIKSHLSDKWLAKEYVKSVLGEKYIIKTLGVYNKFEDIDFSSLPNEFVLKSTHGSGQVAIVRDKSKINLTELKTKATNWLSQTYAFYSGFEMHYQNIIPRLIVEELVSGINDDLYDYKIMCFNGNPELIWVDSDRFKGHKRNCYDLKWNLLPVKYHYEINKTKLPKPKQLNELLKLSKKLSADFALCRCDFYILQDGSIKFGELTFTSGSGIDRFDPISYDYTLGEKLKLPSKTPFKKLTKNQILKAEKEFLKKYSKEKISE